MYHTPDRCKQMTPIEKVHCLDSWFALDNHRVHTSILYSLRLVNKRCRELINQELGFVREVMDQFCSFLLKPTGLKARKFNKTLSELKLLYQRKNKRKRTLYSVCSIVMMRSKSFLVRRFGFMSGDWAMTKSQYIRSL